MATAAILEKVNIAEASAHCCHGFCKVLLQNIHSSSRNMKYKSLAYFCGYHWNGSHFEKGKYSKSTYSWRLSFL
jgi:hypothetical protein